MAQEQHTPDGTFHSDGGAWMPVVDRIEPVAEPQLETPAEPAKPTPLSMLRKEEETLATDLLKLLRQ